MSNANTPKHKVDDDEDDDMCIINEVKKLQDRILQRLA
jgi:hypothetical protein